VSHRYFLLFFLFDPDELFHGLAGVIVLPVIGS